jgi:hypothetical protein
MTRKALRKKRRTLAKQQSIRPSGVRSATPWMAVGALVASATFSGRRLNAAGLNDRPCA